MKSQIKKIVMGNKTSEELFKTFWIDNGFKGVKADNGQTITVPVQRLLHQDNKEVLKQYKGMARKALTKQMTSSEVESHVPLVFDPEILAILKQNAPFKEAIATEGQQGYKAVYQRIDSRDDPIGFTSESEVVDLSGTSGKNIGFAKKETDMTIYVDLVDISDFTQSAAEHYMNVEDTVLGERLALYAQRVEKQMLYGDTSLDTKSGFIGDANGFDGLAKIYTDKGNSVDKSGTTDNFIKDIKGEIHQMLQDENVNINDLMVLTSWTFFDELSNELVPGNSRFSETATAADVGIRQLRISGVPVMASHNVGLQQAEEKVLSTSTGDNEVVVANDYTSVLEADDTVSIGGSDYTVSSVSYSSSDNETTITFNSVDSDLTGETATIDITGSDRDVFIVNTRAVRRRLLVPLSTVPLGRLGLSERTALFEYGAMIERTDGNWGRYLKAYGSA